MNRLELVSHGAAAIAAAVLVATLVVGSGRAQVDSGLSTLNQLAVLSFNSGN